MSPQFVEYPLRDGYIHNWLVAGPQTIALERGQLEGDADRSRLFARFAGAGMATPVSGIEETPVERGPVDAGRFTLGDYQGGWTYYACAEDHCVDHSGYYPAAHYLRSWAYVEVVTARAQSVTAVLRTEGLADVWAADAHVFRAEPEERGSFRESRFSLPLEAGVTPLLVRFENIGMRHTAHGLALRLCREPGQAEMYVRFPTLMPDLRRRNAFEEMSADAYVDRDVYEGSTPIRLCWPEAPRAKCFAHVRLHSAERRIYAVADVTGDAGETVDLGYAVALPAGPMEVTLMPDADEVFVQHMRIFRGLPLWSLGKQRYQSVPAQEMAQRRDDALLAIARIEGSPFAQVARMAWGAWADVDPDGLLAGIARIQAREDGSNLLLLTLLGMLYRWGDHAQFPPEVGQALEACSLGFRYWRDDPNGADRSNDTGDIMDFTAQGNDIVFHACEVLAGQLYPDRVFADGESGAWHQARGERLAQQWMADFGAHGAAAWNAPAAIEREMAALVLLCDLAQTAAVYEMAAVALDKNLFGLAVNSQHGVLGAAGRGGAASFVKSGLLQPTAPISYLLWGMGILNHHVAGVLNMACSTDYQMPTLLQTIAQDAPAELWNREQHAHPCGGEAASIATYKTPDYMLSSLQDYRAGQSGDQEQVCRATLGAEAVVFVTHPGSSSESDSRMPGYWAGNARLPRVAQWKDVLIAHYRLEAEDLLGFTHAYFPTAGFDEYTLRRNWAFARCGDGYLAITTDSEMTLTPRGRYALRELRAQNAASGGIQRWLVQMGRAARDGDFGAFQESVLTQLLDFDAAGVVRYTALSGDMLRFGWEGPLVVNEQVQATASAYHYENPYTTTPLPAASMEILRGDDGLRLDFSHDDVSAQ